MYASFEVLCFVHPSRCLVVWCARGLKKIVSFGLLCFVHPSRCLVLCILRGAVFCASFEVPCYVHPSRRCSLGFCFFGKMSPPLPNELLPGGGLCRKVSSLLWNFDRLFAYHRGNARKFRIFEKTSPPFLHAVVFGGFCSFCCVD